MRIAFSDEAFAQLQELAPEQRTSVTNLIRAVKNNPDGGWFWYKRPQGEIIRIAPGMHANLAYLVSWEVAGGTILIIAIITIPFPSQTDYEEKTKP
ncbi:hypothetical protein K2Z83_22795 [Oscillochloris sp. ZM17-4]|uniref:hypothetical protein n=1 Tax=Oscillochloris sp. ZM17-4 TaxID=2866714 RepID=UPI001C73BB5D|nr:hypothetical protein [Oscillochloris sp. ZM17-4]MBX0330487.1 hypothetical protein [Oscillochloris sp. ZM17-4]